MRIHAALCLSLFMIAAATRTAAAAEPGASASAQRFEALKNLAGDWVERSKDGKPGDRVVSSFRVTAAGSAVIETIFPGSDHEMVTVYHLDGLDLVLTHYCVLANQPRLRAESGGDPGRVDFKYVGASNLKSDADQHINQAQFTFLGPDHFKVEWSSCKDGQPCHQIAMDLVRKPK